MLKCSGRSVVVVGKWRTGPKQKEKREIKLLANRRHHLGKQWRKEITEEQEGLKILWEEVKKNIGSLQRAGCICRRRKEMERSSFFKNPYRHAGQQLEYKVE